MASKRIILLTQFDPTGWREEKERGKKHRGQEGENFRERERESTFSLYFSTIGPSNPCEARDKVDPHCKGYAWVHELWSFDNSGR